MVLLKIIQRMFRHFQPDEKSLSKNVILPRLRAEKAEKVVITPLYKTNKPCYNKQAVSNAPVAQWIEHRIPVPRVGGSSPFRRTITDTVIDTIVSVTVSVFLCSFYWKQGVFPNFATHFRILFPRCCGLTRCTDAITTTYRAFISLNNRNSLYSR